jgi:pimeloyl-ACP methyl ester carboxylesterase
MARRGFDFSFDRSVDVMGRLLRNLRAGPYVLAFPCVMGFAAMGVAERWPLLVRKIVTMQAPAWGDALLWKARRDPHGLLQRPVVGQLAMRALRRERAPRWFRLAMPEGDAQAALVRSTDRAFSHGASFGLASAFQRFLVGDVPFRTPTQPVLSVWGARDRSHPAPSQPVSGERVRAHVLEHAGHFPDLEDPARFARLVTDFVLG